MRNSQRDAPGIENSRGSKGISVGVCGGFLRLFLVRRARRRLSVGGKGFVRRPERTVLSEFSYQSAIPQMRRRRRRHRAGWYFACARIPLSSSLRDPEPGVAIYSRGYVTWALRGITPPLEDLNKISRWVKANLRRISQSVVVCQGICGANVGGFAVIAAVYTHANYFSRMPRRLATCSLYCHDARGTWQL